MPFASPLPNLAGPIVSGRDPMKTPPRPPAQDSSTLVELLRRRAGEDLDRDAFTFLADAVTVKDALSYGELDRRARAVAGELQSRGLAGERALLLYPPGLDYVAAFFGCL